MPSPKLTNTIVDDDDNNNNNNNNPADGGNNTSTTERLSDLLPPKQRSPRDNKIVSTNEIYHVWPGFSSLMFS
jgi:hypothetical protein